MVINIENNWRHLGGFTFAGVDIATLGLGYAPELQETVYFQGGTFQTQEQTFPGKDGGYLYGTYYQPKQFNLRCVFEDMQINNGIIAKIDSFFYKGKTGRLVFDDRPWCYYIASVVGVDYSQLKNKYNGIIYVRFKAYYPFARTDYTWMSEPAYVESMTANSALLPANINPPIEYTISGDSDILLYNGGTKPAKVTVDIGGNIGSGLSIYNTTNGSQCAFMGLSSGSSSEYVELDGLTGNCYFIGGTNNGKPAFSKHNYGFIELAPAFPAASKLHLTHSEDDLTQIKTTDTFTQDMVGKYLCLTYVNQNGETHTNEWVRIISVADEHAAYVNVRISSMEQEAAPTTMNVLHIDTSPDGDEVWLRFLYSHTFI